MSMIFIVRAPAHATARRTFAGRNRPRSRPFVKKPVGEAATTEMYVEVLDVPTETRVVRALADAAKDGGHSRAASWDKMLGSAALFAARGGPMSYLYGDSTPSTLEMNYIEFLRDAVDFCVQVLLADQRMAEAGARIRLLDHSTTAEIERLEQLGATVEKAITGLSPGAPDSATARCATAIVRAAGGLVRAEVGAVQSGLS